MSYFQLSMCQKGLENDHTVLFDGVSAFLESGLHIRQLSAVEYKVQYFPIKCILLEVENTYYRLLKVQVLKKCTVLV